MTREITDEVIKKKHAEFNDRLKTVLEELRNKSRNGQPDIVTKLKDAARFFRSRKVA